MRDALYTDAPGEWFTRWVKNQSADDAKGARWIVDNATHFLFFIDRSALAGQNVGKVRNDTLQLARLLSEKLNKRPITVIWAKSDLQTDLEVEAPIRKKLDRFFGSHKSFDLDVTNPLCLEVMKLTLAEITLEPYQMLRPEGVNSAFLALPE